MPLYEFRCPACGAQEEVFVRTVVSEVPTPSCSARGCGAEMTRMPSAFTRHLTEVDKMVEAEAKFGKEVDAVMGPTPDIGKHVRRYDRLAKDLPPPDVP